MAGHTRSVDTGQTRRTDSGRRRRVREHLPPGEAEAAKRAKQHLGARTTAADRVSRERDPLRRLDIAREYVRSAAAKYDAPAEIDGAVNALMTAGDRIYTAGMPVTAAARRTRRAHATRAREKRRQTKVLVREGLESVRRQRAERTRAS